MTKQYEPWHEAEQIAPGTWRICEVQSINCYLLEGTERALLIDTGLGIGDLGAVVRDLTDLPVTVALTHRHCDHAGGRGWFKSRTHVHEADMSLSGALTSSRPAGWLLGRQWAKPSDFPRQPYSPDLTAMTEGAVFELGGRSVSVIHTPGHTRGSVVFLDNRERLMYTGDEVNSDTWLWLPGSTSIEEWLAGAKRIRSLCDRYRIFSGHGDGRVGKELVEALIDAGEHLVKQTRRNAILGRTEKLRDEDGSVLITYSTGRVRAKR